MKETEKVEVIDWNVYGALMHNTRVKCGYASMEGFAKSLWLRTRIKVSKETLYKIEQGKYPPSTEVFFGINLTLFGEYLPKKLFNIAVCDEWEDIAYASSMFRFDRSAPLVPEKWAEENRYAVSSEAGSVIDNYDENGNYDPYFLNPDEALTPEACALHTGEPLSVFVKRNESVEYPFS